MMQSERDVWGAVEFVDSVTAATRSRLSLFWFPMVAFGVVSLFAAIAVYLFGLDAAGLVWFVGGCVGGIATTVHYQRSNESDGLRTDATPYFFVVAVLALGNFLLPFLIDGDPAWAISLWTGASYLAFARLERSSTILLVAGSFVALGLLFFALSVPLEFVWFSAVSGVVLLIGARAARPREIPA